MSLLTAENVESDGMPSFCLFAFFIGHLLLLVQMNSMDKVSGRKKMATTQNITVKLNKKILLTQTSLTRKRKKMRPPSRRADAMHLMRIAQRKRRSMILRTRSGKLPAVMQQVLVVLPRNPKQPKSLLPSVPPLPLPL